jgi:hypothetical protein
MPDDGETDEDEECVLFVFGGGDEADAMNLPPLQIASTQQT